MNCRWTSCGRDWRVAPPIANIAVYCQVGQRGYLATRILRQAGRRAANLGGGYKTYRLFHPEVPPSA